MTTAKAPQPPRGRLEAGQISRLVVTDIDNKAPRVVLESDGLYEAPNWTPDGKDLIINGGGRIYRVPADGSGAPEMIDTGSVDTCNNDHCLSPDGKTLYISASGHLYSLPIVGGTPKRISNTHPGSYVYYLHGVSPDGKTLAYVVVEKTATGQRANIATIPAAGGPDTRLTNIAEPEDGPEYSPDGKWIYYNSERASPGHAQIFRMRPDGSGHEQLTFDERVNWFPHFPPDGKHILYISYPPGTTGHPANRDVILRLMAPDGGPSRDIVAFFGGQGTVNVNSWAPDNRRFAYMAYPVVK